MAKSTPRLLLLSVLELLLQNPGKEFTVQDIKQDLGNKSIDVSERNLQRLFEELYAHHDHGHPIGLEKTTGERGNQHRHHIRVDSPLLKASSQNSFKMLLAFLSQNVPLSQRYELNEQLGGLQAFLERVYVAPESVLLPAAENPAVVDTVYAAIQQKRYLSLHYQNARLQQTKFDFYPWGVMLKGQNSYLIGNKAKSSTVLTLAMYRIREATLLEQQERLTDAEELVNSSFREFCKSRGVAWFLRDKPEMLKIKLHFFNSGGHLAQMRLAENQQITHLAITEQKFPCPTDPDYFEMQVTATVPDSRKLDEWILSFGAEVEVLAPDVLRNRIKDKLLRLAALYQS